jgi:O-antigen ligase
MPKPARRSRPTARRDVPPKRRDFADRLARWCVLALLGAVPLVVLPTARDSFTLPKALASEWLALASLCALAVSAALRDPGAGADQTSSWRLGAGALLRTPVVSAVAPFLLVATASWFWSLHPATTREALIPLWIGATGLVTWSLHDTALDLRRLLSWTIPPAVVLAILGILQVHGLFQPFGLEAQLVDRGQGTSLAGNVGVLGGVLVLPLLILLETFLAPRGTLVAAKARWFDRAGVRGVAAAVLLYGLFVSQTLTALAALGLGGLALILLRADARRRRQALFAVVAVVVVGAVAGPLVSQRTAQKFEQLRRGDWNGVLSYRGDGWRSALEIFGQHPLSGAGHGTFRAEFAEARLRLVAAGHPVAPASVNVHFANAHNDVLEVAAELGVAGLAALGWGLWELTGALRRSRSAFAVAGTVALGVFAVGYFPFETPLLAYPALVFLAGVFAASPRADVAAARGAP